MFGDLIADTGAPQQFDRPAFQHAGANPAFDIGSAATLQHDAVHTAEMQQLRKQQTGRSAANNRHLRLSSSPLIAYRFVRRVATHSPKPCNSV